MGYSATFDGMVILSTAMDPLKLQEKAQDVFLNNVAITDLCATDYTLWIGGYEAYSDDDVFRFLQDITPYTFSGEIAYCGDDNELWRHIFDESIKQWREQQGGVIYESDGLTIADMIEHRKAIDANLRLSDKPKQDVHER